MIKNKNLFTVYRKTLNVKKNNNKEYLNELKYNLKKTTVKQISNNWTMLSHISLTIPCQARGIYVIMVSEG